MTVLCPKLVNTANSRLEVRGFLAEFHYDHGLESKICENVLEKLKSSF